MAQVENYDINRIRNDLAKAKAKLAGHHAGQHVSTDSGMPPDVAARAWENNTRNVYATVARLEQELVYAMCACGAWSHSEIIRRMESAPAAAPPAPPPPAKPTADDVRAELRRILSKIPDDATVQSVKELIAS